MSGLSDAVASGLQLSGALDPENNYYRLLAQQKNAIAMSRKLRAMQLDNQFAPQEFQDKHNMLSAQLTGQNIRNQYLPEYYQTSNAYKQAIINQMPDSLKYKQDMLMLERQKLAQQASTKDVKVIPTQDGYIAFNRQTGDVHPIQLGGHTVKPIEHKGNTFNIGGQGAYMTPDGHLNIVGGNPPTTQNLGGEVLPNNTVTGNLKNTPTDDAAGPAPIPYAQQSSSQLIPNIVQPGSRYGQGRGYFRTNPDGSYSGVMSPTATELTTLQKQGLGEETFGPTYLNNAESILKSQGGVKGAAQRALGYVEGIFGAHNDLTRKQAAYAGAVNNLLLIGDGILKTLGLNATTQMANTVHKAISPGMFDSKAQFIDKASDILGSAMYRQWVTQKQLREGIGTSGNIGIQDTVNKAHLIKYFSNEVRNHLRAANGQSDDEVTLIMTPPDKNKQRQLKPMLTSVFNANRKALLQNGYAPYKPKELK